MSTTIDPQAKKTVSQEVRDILKENLGNKYKEYYIGDPFQLPQQAMPCLVVELQNETVVVENTAQDRITYTVLIKIVSNKKSDFNRFSKDVLNHERLQILAAGRDKATNAYLTSSIMGVLRTKFTIGDRFTNNSHTIEYGIASRPQDQSTSEAHITLTLSELVLVGTRT